MFARNRIVIGLLSVLVVIGVVSCSPSLSAGREAESRSLFAAAQAGGEITPRTVNVNGVGEASAAPDVADVVIGVEIVDPDPNVAVTQSTERMTAVTGALTAMGVEDKDIQTIDYRMWIEPQYDREGQPTGENRYHVVNQVRIRLRDLAQVGALLGKALEAGANTVGGVTFSVADPTALQEQARQRATANARAKAEQLATGLNAVLGSLRQVSEFSSWVGPIEAPMAEKAIGGGGPVPVSAGTFTVRVEIQVVFDLAE